MICTSEFRCGKIQIHLSGDSSKALYMFVLNEKLRFKLLLVVWITTLWKMSRYQC